MTPDVTQDFIKGIIQLLPPEKRNAQTLLNLAKALLTLIDHSKESPDTALLDWIATEKAEVSWDENDNCTIFNYNGDEFSASNLRDALNRAIEDKQEEDEGDKHDKNKPDKDKDKPDKNKD